MMSGIRQRVTGRTIQNFLIWGVGIAVLWWAPIIVLRFWPGLLIASKEPWLLDLSDLNWHRVLLNLVTKQGFRAVWVMLWSLGWIALMSAPVKPAKRPLLRTWGKRLSRVNFRSSTEWVMDGSKRHALGEYAVWVGVV